MNKQQHLMTALFPDRESAELGYSALSERGYTSADVDVLMSEYAQRRYFTQGSAKTELGAKAMGPASASAATLMGCNIPEQRMRQYDRGIRNGGILMLVMPRSNEDAWHIDNLWRINRAQDVYC